MVGIITPSSSLNSFSSICYCFIALGIHSYCGYKAVSRYREAESRAWPGGGGTPSESGLMLGLTVVSLITLPLFVLTCFLKVGNFANDGIKLGRDHALGSSLEAAKDCSMQHHGMRRVWRHLCPISQTLHLVAAFLLLLPETLLTAVEVKFGYKSTDACWVSNLDFLYPPERALLSEIRSSVNVSQYSNATHVILPTPRVPTEGWNEQLSVSIAFVNFCFALTCFLVRYASVFWYTNKPLTVVFALQLLAMVLNSVFSFNTFSTLYCVCYNQKMYNNATLSLACSLDLILYLFGSTILMLSTMNVFEYGSHYFHEKFRIVERHHSPESYIKQTMIVNSGCQGYVAHLCAMAALIVFAVCKGPLLYDLVSLMRLTGDQLLLSGIVCEVCYMVMWVALWFGLTIKQQWQFRILDYVPLRQPLYGLPDDSVTTGGHQGRGDGSHTDSLTKTKRLSGRDFPQRYLDPAVPGANSSSDDQCHSDLGTDESDMINSTAEIVLDLDGHPISENNPNFRRSRNRRNNGQRVTFDESARGRNTGERENQHTPTSSLTRQGCVGGTRLEDTSHLNVTADVHSSTPSSSNSSNESTQEVVMRTKTTGLDNREYRDSIRSKCGEYYPSTSNLSSSFEEAMIGPPPPPMEPLPTLMSSFRDKVRESSLAASTFKERERHMLENFDYLDPLPPPIVDDLPNNDAEKRRCIALSDEDIGDVNYRLQNNVGDRSYGLDNGVGDGKFSKDDIGSYRLTHNYNKAHQRQSSHDGNYRFDNNVDDVGGGYRYDTNVNSSSLKRQKQHNASLSSDEGHRSSLVNTTIESSDVSLLPLAEDIQHDSSRGVTSLGGAHRKGMEDYQSHHHHPPPVNGMAIQQRPK